MNCVQCKKIKDLLRKTIRDGLKSFLLSHSRAEESEKACRSFLSDEKVSQNYEKSEIILAYIATENECDCLLLIKDALKKSKTVAVPRVKSGSSEMEFYVLEDEKEIASQLEKGSFGISEPKTTLKKFSPDEALEKNVFMIVPGVAFTKSGKRLGHGKGFYDFYIPRLKTSCRKVFLCGFAFSCQKSGEEFTVDEKKYPFPIDEHDEIMDAVIFS